MAVLKGVKERVHLPLYDSLFVRPRKQLREIESSSVLKFFVNVQGKTKLETNMQSGSLLPHWNTFEARAMRVVISDLPATFPDEVEKCIKQPNGAGSSQAACALARCFDDLSALIDSAPPPFSEQRVNEAIQLIQSLEYAIDEAGKINADFPGCLGILRSFTHPEKILPILQFQTELKAIHTDLATLIRRTRIAVDKPDELSALADKLDSLHEAADERLLLKQFKGIDRCLLAFDQLISLTNTIQGLNFHKVEDLLQCVPEMAKAHAAQIERAVRLKACLTEVRAEIDALTAEANRAQAAAVKKCLNQHFGDKRLIPIDEQLFGDGGLEILSKLIYNSVTTFSVGEKNMIQMPTWFFPAGAGPFSEDGQSVTHGFPAPEATFRFAEPVSVDTQQNFRVEIEFPESGVIQELQRIYGPFFMWVVLDGYMTRDVQ